MYVKTRLNDCGLNNCNEITVIDKSLGKMTIDKMPVDKLTKYKMSVDKMTMD